MKNLITIFRSWRLPAMLLAALISWAAHAADASLPPVRITPLTDLSADLAEVGRSGRPLLLIFSAEYCPYCERLKESIIKPMLRSGDYDDRIIIRVTELDSYETIRGADGEKIEPPELASRYDVGVTPTLLILGPNGEELAPRQLGINNEDYYGAYLDRAIDEAVARLRGKPAAASRD